MTFKNAYRKFLGRGREAAEFWTSTENIEGRLKQQFEGAKALSDFIGMIVRFGFGLGATTYFGKRIAELGGSFRSYVFGVCWATSLALTIALGTGIISIIFAYEMRAVGHSKGFLARLFFASLAVTLTGCLWYGLNDLAGAIGGTFATGSKR